MTPLRRRMIEDLSARGLAEKTQGAYLRAVSRLARFYNKSPDALTMREVQRFLIHLSEDCGLGCGKLQQLRPRSALFLHGDAGP